MPQQDSIKSIIDTLVDLQKDSGNYPDSIFLSDSIKSANHIDTTSIRFDGILHPSLPVNENWVFITLLVLFVMSVFSYLRSSGWLIESFRTFFQVKDRGSIFSKSTASDFESRALLILFSIGVFSLYSYLILNTTSEKFIFSTFIKFLGVTAGFYLVKYLILKMAGFVFLHPAMQKLAFESYYNLLIFLGIILYPLLVFHIYFPDYLSFYVEITSLVICLLACLIYIIKLFLIFFDKIVATFYILLYLCTLEILPFVLLFYVYNFML